MIEFCKVYKVKNLVKGATRYKNLKKPCCIDLILTNRTKNFQGCHIVEDFHTTEMSLKRLIRSFPMHPFPTHGKHQKTLRFSDVLRR